MPDSRVVGILRRAATAFHLEMDYLLIDIQREGKGTFERVERVEMASISIGLDPNTLDTLEVGRKRIYTYI